MSGELKPKPALAVGTEIVVSDPDPRRKQVWTAKVAKIARVWITMDNGRRFRADTQTEGLEFGWGGLHFRTVEQVVYESMISAAWTVLKEHGLAEAPYQDKIHDAELFAVAELLKGRGIMP